MSLSPIIMVSLLTLGLRVQASAHSAQIILFQGPSSKSLDFQATLKAHGEFTSPSQVYLKSRPRASQRELLSEAFADAQKAFLENSTEHMHEKFVAVLALLPSDDWAKSDREIFLNVYLRLAQIERDARARDRWLNLSLLLGEGLSYDRTLYPPPIVLRRRDLMAQTAKKVIERGFAAGWNEILINGQRCGMQNCGEWPVSSGRVRVTFVSDQWLPQSVVLELSEVAHLKPRTVPWAEGDCSKTQWHVDAAKITRYKKIFWSLECDQAEILPRVNLQAGSSPFTNPLPIAAASTATSSTQLKTPFYRSIWLWAGIGTVVTVLLLQQTKSQESSEPTSNYGY